MNIELKNIPCFGIAGNFTGHLEQAGEDKDFLKIQTEESNAPKAIFPTYIPKVCKNSCDFFIPEYLRVFPFSSDTILFPKEEFFDDSKFNLQMESECAVIFELEWKKSENQEKNEILKVIPKAFCASNDCSIRREGAKKISEKKNWGKNSKGISEHFIQLCKNDFCSNGKIDSYRIASFVKRNGILYEYGTDSAIRNYSYIYEKLLFWIKEKLNNQKDEGPCENIFSYLNALNCPEKILISIGATRYTNFGENNFLKKNDVIYIVLYPETDFTGEKIKNLISNENFSDKRLSVLRQIVM